MLCTSLLGIGLCFLFLFFHLLRMQRPKNFPPGPLPVPILGNLLQINPRNPMDSLGKLSERYGKVYSLYIGGRPAVVLHGLQSMKEALVTRSVDFAGRPEGLMVNHVTNNKGFIMANYGPTWKEQRRFALTTMKNLGLRKESVEEKILEETSYICSHLEKSAGSSMDPQTLFHSAVSNIICCLLFGSRYEYEDKRLHFIINSFAENAKVVNGVWAMVYDTMPVLRRLPLPFQRVFKNYDALTSHTLGVVAQHKRTRTPGEPRDFIDSYLDEVEKVDISDSRPDEERFIMLLLDLYFAGTDTTSNTIRTAFLYLTTHQDVQERCQEEIETVLAGRAQASYDDRHRMPYVWATVHEIQRVANIAPLGVFHTTTRNTQLMGYDIPEGTLIIPNISSVLFEESQWKQPHKFNPSRFVNEQGAFVRPEAFMAFSAGHRVCLGEVLARMEVFLILVTLLRRFQFVWPQDGGTPDHTPVFGGIQSPRPYRLCVMPRKIQGG